ncbi:MAG: 6-phosphogluconolactonase [Chloroflexota bacterium]
MNRKKIHVLDTPEAVGQMAARFTIQWAKDAIAERGKFVMAVSGGSTPQPFFSHLITLKDQVDWSKVHLFWVDERLVPLSHPESNAGTAFSSWVPLLGMPQQNVHTVPVHLPPKDAAREYARQLDQVLGVELRLDLVHLGLGIDGHVASLFPDSSALDTTEPVALVSAHYQERPTQRITLNLPIINAARKLMFLVTGAEKSSIVRRVLKGNTRLEEDLLPAQRVRTPGRPVLWLLDVKAASLIESS